MFPLGTVVGITVGPQFQLWSNMCSGLALEGWILLHTQMCKPQEHESGLLPMWEELGTGFCSGFPSGALYTHHSPLL